MQIHYVGGGTPQITEPGDYGPETGHYHIYLRKTPSTGFHRTTWYDPGAWHPINHPRIPPATIGCLDSREAARLLGKHLEGEVATAGITNCPKETQSLDEIQSRTERQNK